MTPAGGASRFCFDFFAVFKNESLLGRASRVRGMDGGVQMLARGYHAVAVIDRTFRLSG
jgi:hypothetical protein